ncbi:hypothetical protein CDCA_CDCA03G1003 [Cyanidium caldarium]|uniref:nicotinamidase n=1 Tax=Cyanidium caldarium TaxID=2771 RepID=A0AAV9ISX4_CYACA|nr:hypothetical protein CDCA_CDCA03G1003 [Cyanidium caldarium]|eukprot:ctg_129.g93
MSSSSRKIEPTEEALIVVDVQNDFCPPEGALAVPRGDEVVPVINLLRPAFRCVVFTQDWHPPGHVSFASAHPGHQALERVSVALPDGRSTPQVLWPDHCVQETVGAQLHRGLQVDAPGDLLVRKGTDARYDSYSAFKDDSGVPTGLAEQLRQRGVTHVLVCGLALDYCVRATACDALDAGFRVSVIVDATRGIDEVDCAKALATFRELGIQAVTARKVLQERMAQSAIDA